MTQKESWDLLIKLQRDLNKIQIGIKDFAVEEAIDMLNEAVTNYLNEEE